MKYFQQPSVMTAQQHFSNVPKAEIQRSRFDRSHGLKTTFDAGVLVPIYWDEVLPGDSFHLKETTFARLATPLKPVMDNMYLDTFYFFVPYRLVWDNWQRFCGERTSPSDDPTTLTIPTCTVNITAGTPRNILAFHFGLPQLGDGVSYTVSELPFRAYWLIWNEWFRDQNLQNPATVNTGDAENPGLWAFGALRGKRHDYFTSCLPWPQKGDPVMIPVGPLVDSGTFLTAKPGTAGSSRNLTVRATGPNEVFLGGAAVTADTGLVYTGGIKIADTEATGGATINDLRAAFQIQRLLERDARGGTRYIELIRAHFGVVSDDARLQRPEYLGGGSSRISINPVSANFASETVPQGQLAGYGTVLNQAGFSKSFTEHGIIIGLANVRADLTYQQGIDRFWSRRTRYDFYWPALANLGEQAVLNKEIYYQGVPAQDDAVFGYQERYAEYRYKPSRITGQFNSSETNALDVWHLGQDFAALPVLNDSFIRDQPPVDRIIAVASEPHLLCDVWFNLQCERPMPVYAVPGMVDHF